jgi:hypothetical protein
LVTDRSPQPEREPPYVRRWPFSASLPSMVHIWAICMLRRVMLLLVVSAKPAEVQK